MLNGYYLYLKGLFFLLKSHFLIFILYSLRFEGLSSRSLRFFIMYFNLFLRMFLSINRFLRNHYTIVPNSFHAFGLFPIALCNFQGLFRTFLGVCHAIHFRQWASPLRVVHRATRLLSFSPGVFRAFHWGE